MSSAALTYGVPGKLLGRDKRCVELWRVRASAGDETLAATAVTAATAAVATVTAAQRCAGTCSASLPHPHAIRPRA